MYQEHAARDVDSQRTAANRFLDEIVSGLEVPSVSIGAAATENGLPTHPWRTVRLRRKLCGYLCGVGEFLMPRSARPTSRSET